MVDLTQPASAVEFQAAGVDASTAAALAAQHNVMAGRGSFEDRVTLAHSLENLPPQAKPAPHPPVSAVEATRLLADHNAAQLQGHMDKLFEPPASAADYKFPTRGDLTDEQFAQDNAIKSAFHSEGWPDWLGNGIPKALSEGERELSRMTPQQQQARIAATESGLKRMWGEQYDRNLATVDTYLEQMARKYPTLGIDGSVRLDDGRDVPLLALLDSIWVDRLFEFANHRAGRR
jgi:hypothetical protein